MNSIEMVVTIELQEKSDGKEKAPGTVVWSQMFTESTLSQGSGPFADMIAYMIKRAISRDDVESKMLDALRRIQELHVLEQKQKQLAEEIKARKNRR